ATLCSGSGKYHLFPQSLVKTAKITALLSAMRSILCAVLIGGRQLIFWFQNGFWDAYPLAEVVKQLRNDQSVVYITASSERFDPTGTREIVDWLLEVPTIVPLLIASALIVMFYRWLATIEKGRGAN